MAQTTDPITKLNELIRGIEIAMLTTIHPDGGLHSCPMAAQPAEADGVVWFLSASNTEKVEAVRTSQRVNVAYADQVSQRYVSISGFCELVRDHDKAKTLWRPQYSAWLPKGLDDPSLILLKVNIQEAEYWDDDAGRMLQLPALPKPIIE